MPKDNPIVGSRYFSAALKTLHSLRIVISKKVSSAVFALSLLTISVTGAYFGFYNTRVYAQTPNTTINYQARIHNYDGSLVADGDYHIEFKIYSTPTASGTPDQGACTKNSGTADPTCLWVETRSTGNLIRVVNGYVSANLGSVTAFPSNMPWGNDLYVTMRVGGKNVSATWDTEMVNFTSGYRMKITAVPYAFQAANVVSGNTNAASTNSNNISIQTGNALGTTSNSGGITIDTGTATGTTGTIVLGATNASGITLGRTGLTTSNAGALTVGQLLTASGGATIATGSTFTNASSTLFTAQAIADKPTGGAIGTAAATVDVATTFNVTQTTASQTLTLPTPTVTTAGRIVFVNNVGSTSFVMYGSTIAAGASNSFMWNGTSWVTSISLSGSVVSSIGTIDSQTKSADGAVISTGALYLQTADASYAGLVSTGVQTFAGAKTFSATTVFNAGATVTTGQTFTVNGDGFTDLTGAGLTVSSGALTLDTTSATGAFINGGNTFSGASTIGNNNNADLGIETNGATRLTVQAGGNLSATGQLTLDGTGSNQSQLIVRANTGQTVANPLVLLQNSSSVELARINATTTSLYFGNAAGGNSAAGANNTGIGASALGSVLTGTGNTTLGSGALASVSVGTNNTALGYNAGNLSTGSSNLFLGQGAGANATTGSNNIIIGAGINASSTGVSNELRIGGVLQGDTSTLAAQFNGTLAVASLGTADTSSFICRNTSNILAGCNSTPLTSSLTDNITDAFDLQEGTNNYININTTNSSENISFGNATTNPSFSFLGGGTLAVGGAASFQNASNSTTGFNVKTSAGGNLFTVDTLNSRVGINLTGSNVPTLTGNGLQLQGALSIAGSGSSSFFDNYTTPGSATVRTRLGIAFEPSAAASNQILALGIGSGSDATSRVVSVFDARSSTDNQPAIGVFSPNESDIVGFSWDGSNSVAKLKTVSGSSSTAGITIVSGNVTGGSSQTTGTISILSGNGAGTNSSSGNVIFDAGSVSGSGTAGQVRIANTNAASVLLGRAGILTTNPGSLTVGQDFIVDTSTFVVDSTNDAVGIRTLPTSTDSFVVTNGSTSDNILRLQDNATDVLTVADGGNVTLTADLAVNGDDITSDGNLTVNATGYVRIGDTGTPGVASGDDDLYVEGDVEIDATLTVDGGATILGATNINTTGTAATSIGSLGAVTTLTGSSILLNSATLQRTAAGATSLDLVDSSNTTFSLINSGAGVANLTVDGSITVATLGSTDNASFLCRNSSNTLAGCNYTPLNPTLTDNIADALDIQEGTNNYFNINTTNSSENISFGNATTNPSFSFLGTGTTTFNSGSVSIANASASGLSVSGTNPQVSVGTGALGFASSAGAYSTISGVNDLILRNAAANLILSAQNASGNIYFTTGSTDSAKLTILNNGNATFSNNLTLGSGVGVGLLTNNGATQNTTQDYADQGTDLTMTAATSIDVYTAFTFNQSTTGRTITVPAPTAGAAGRGRVIYISNRGSSSFTLSPNGASSLTLSAGSTTTLYWNGAAWTYAGVDGGSNSYIQNQNSSDQTANFRITGTGQVAGIDALSGAGLALGGTNATSVTVGNTTNTASISLQGTNAATYTVGTATGTGTITLGQATTATTAAVNILSANGTASTQTITIGGGTSTTSGGKVVNIATGTPGAGTTNTIAIGSGGTTTGTVGVTIGSNGAAAHTTVLQGGNGSTAISIQAATGGVINIATTNANDIRVGGKMILTGGLSPDITTVGGATSTGIVIQPGAATGASSNGADVTIKGGNGTGATAVTGGSLIFQGGNATQVTGTQNGGSLTFDAGTGNTANGSLLLGSNVDGVITIGKTTAVSTLTVGQSTATNTISIGSANTATGNTQTINIGAGTPAGTGKAVVTVGNLGGASLININAGTGNAAGDLNLQTAAGGIINIGTSAVTNKVLNLGTIGNVVNASTVHIADTIGNATQAVTIGSVSSANNVLLLQGGTSSTAVRLAAGSGGTITVGSQSVANTISVGTVGTAAFSSTINIGTSTGAGQTVTVGSTHASSNLTLASGNAINVNAPAFTFSTGGARSITVAQAGASTTGYNLTVSAGGGGTGTGSAGGVLNLQGGSASGTNANGGNVIISGGAGVGTGVKGLTVVDTTAYSAAAVQNFTADANITQANIDTYGSILISGNVAGWKATLTDPTITTTGRVIYITNSGGVDMTLAANTVGVALSITLKPASTATMYWNGTDWTAAGASSSTDLQAAYSNTATSAGGAEIVLSSTGTGGLTVRNDATTPIIGGLLEVQTSIGSNLFTVNNNATEYANNGGAESATFTMWAAAPAGGTVSRYTTVDSNIATGAGSVFSNNTSTANTGIKNTLTTTLTQNLKYKVSYTVRASTTTAFNTLDTIYSSDGTSTTQTCTSGSSVDYSTWTRVDCSFTATAVGASNAIIIRHSDAVDHDFYVDNLSVTVSADVNHANDGSVDSALGTNWTDFGANTSGTTAAIRNTTVLYDTSGSVEKTTGATADRGVVNNLAITPSINTQYLVTLYAKSSNTFNDIRIRYSRDGGTNFASCVDYNTQSVSTTAYTKITCVFTTDGTAASNPDLIIDQPTATARTFYIDALSITLNTNNSSNVQIGGANKGGPTTLFTLDRSAGAPIAANNDAYLGSMYYDTITGRIQCYESDGWGACGAAPDNIVNLNPEYAGAVLNGTGVGTMTADFCSNDTALSINSTLCSTGQAKNYYKWTSPQSTQQTYSIYVTYQLPATFNGFSDDNTVQLVARTDSLTNAEVTYEMFKSTGSAVTACGTETTVVTTANTWQSVGINGNESTGCSFNSSSASNFVIFKINMKAKSNANAYVSTLSFTTTGR